MNKLDSRLVNARLKSIHLLQTPSAIAVRLALGYSDLARHRNSSWQFLIQHTLSTSLSDCAG